MGSPSEAASLLASSSERLTEIGERNLRSTVEGFLGEAHARVSDFPLAAVAARACRALAAEDDWASQLLWRQVDAKVYAAQGNLARAKALICEAIEIADRTDFLTMAAAVHLDACAILELAGEPGASGAERETAAQLLRRKGVNSSAVVGGVQIGLLMK
jgi:ATP/maltotriose-dependent transcriptional regulator MalT